MAPVSSSRSKSVAIAFLLGALLTGAASGYAAGRMSAPKPKQGYSREYDERSMRGELARELQLSEQQAVTVDSVLDWRKRRYRELMDPVRPSLDSARDSARVLIMQALNPVQQDLFIKLRERMQAQSDSARAASKER